MPENKKSLSLQDLFMQSAAHIKKIGFQVYVCKDKEKTYGFYSDGKNVAYFQQNEFRPGVNIATVNVTPGSSARGFFLEPDAKPVPIKSLTKDYLEKGFQKYPDFFSKEDRNMMPSIEKYQDIQQFLKDHKDENLIELQ